MDKYLREPSGVIFITDREKIIKNIESQTSSDIINKLNNTLDKLIDSEEDCNDIF